MSSEKKLSTEKVEEDYLLNGTSKCDAINDDTGITAFEKLLEAVGSEGVFQRRLIWWFMFPFSIAYGMAEVHFIFILSTPDHVCHVPGREYFENTTLEEWHNLTIPWEENQEGGLKISACQMYDISSANFSYLDNNEGDLSQLDLPFHENNVTECLYGWDYDKSVWKATAVTNFDWVCNKKNIVTNLLTLRMIGGTIGNFAFAVLSDKYGRLPMFYISLFLCAVFGPATALATSSLIFTIFQFLHSLAFYQLYQMPYIIIVELCGERLRNLTVVSSFLGWVTGVCLVSLLTWLIGDWKKILFALNLPSAIFFLFWWLVPESPRFLLSTDKIGKFKKVMTKIANYNGKTLGPDFDNLILIAQEDEKKKVPFSLVLKSWVLIKHLILLSIVLSMAFMFYTGISLNLHNMTGSMFLNYFMLTIFELPGILLGHWSSSYFGRRLSAVFYETLATALIIIPVFFLDSPWTVALLCSTSKMFSGGTYVSVYKQIGELFPTPLRASAYGVTGVLALASTVFVPSIVALGHDNKATPYYFMCTFALLETIFCTFLPETLGLPYPQTMREAMIIGKDQSYFSIIYKGNLHKKRVQEIKTEESVPQNIAANVKTV